MNTGPFWRGIERFAQTKAKAAEANERIRPRNKPVPRPVRRQSQQRPRFEGGLTEYALIIAFIAVVVIVAMIFLQPEMARRMAELTPTPMP